jgi:predicted nucleotidyltransferase
MAVSIEQLQEVVRVLRQEGARRVLLFGSAVRNLTDARDIDIAVEGVPLGRILHADVAVNDLLGVPTDLVSREENPGFFDLISQGSRVLYEEK